MDVSKTRFVLLGLCVLGLGVIIGTALWMKLEPRPQFRGAAQQPLEGLSRYGAVPEFSLVERSGKTIRLADLHGTIWIANFIYTTCQDTCPLQSAEMAKLQEQWSDKPDLRLVSFSVDPAKDTPQVLSRYAERFNADTARWLFLTGEKEPITTLVQKGFRLSAAPAPDAAESGVILHSPRFVLIDREAEIRGYYDSRDPQALKRLKGDVASLLTAPKE
ncbi:MAG TPA: SCO family protein [Candidatus Binatia bacterium]|nr:SCO family protein [Candidatus Binatia bacterium]